MFDVEILLEDRPGALGRMGTALGQAGISVEGGGAWVTEGRGVAHFLFEDGAAASKALGNAGIRVGRVREVVLLRLKQAVPGQLGILTGRMADAGVNIETLYSDHDHRLVLVTDRPEAAQRVADLWACS
ncbi:amino acid-binding ACT domain-containing protein [Gluconobacter thailandicus]|uniref:ACT domain-containing protein n=1 Tax=Gluconobacter thailandicus TaxID=257438 RepID=UPI0007772E49|nr:ACT domain-containing protein [Gluconobacter thailandicus]KXV35878.1 amino acid-binding ACT domain-containing protein [Gluconobacter thailandicus]